jgi:hypothetical protein
MSTAVATAPSTSNTLRFGFRNPVSRRTTNEHGDQPHGYCNRMRRNKRAGLCHHVVLGGRTVDGDGVYCPSDAAVGQGLIRVVRKGSDPYRHAGIDWLFSSIDLTQCEILLTANIRAPFVTHFVSQTSSLSNVPITVGGLCKPPILRRPFPSSAWAQYLAECDGTALTTPIYHVRIPPFSLPFICCLPSASLILLSPRSALRFFIKQSSSTPPFALGTALPQSEHVGWYCELCVRL